MPEYSNFITAILQRPSNTTLTMRNMRIAAGDDFMVYMTLYQNEDASAPVTINGAQYMSFFPLDAQYGAWDQWSRSWSGWDYGSLGWGRCIPPRPILTVTATSDINMPGVAMFAIPPADTQLWLGRYAFLIQVAQAGAGATVARGILDVEPGLILPGPVVNPFTLDQSQLDGPDVLQ